MSSLEELKRLVDIESITAITTNSDSLSIKETLELMGEVSLCDLNTDLTFWTKDQKVVVDKTEYSWGDEIELVSVSLKPSNVITLTGNYVVSDILKNSKARYAHGVKVGDQIEFVLEMTKTSGASKGNYSLMSDVYVNGVLKTRISQNEYYKLLEIFELVPAVV